MTKRSTLSMVRGYWDCGQRTSRHVRREPQLAIDVLGIEARVEMEQARQG